MYRRLAEEGYVTASVGRGTFVRSLVPAAAEEQGDDWQAYVLPDRPTTYQEEILSDAFRLPQREGMVSLATGFPSPRFTAAPELGAIAAEVFRDEPVAAMSYSMPEGLLELREQLAKHGKERGGTSDPDEIIVTSGGQQAIDLAARTLLEPDDVVVVESPTFTGSLLSLRATGRARDRRARGQGRASTWTPSSRCWPATRCGSAPCRPRARTRRAWTCRRSAATRLAELAVERNMFVLEDRVYSDLRYEGEHDPALRRQAPGHVIEVNSLSKVVGAGLRIGWIGARGPVLDRLTMLKHATDFHTATPIQYIVARYLATGGYATSWSAACPTTASAAMR